MADVTERVVSLLGIPQQFDGAAGLTAQSLLIADGLVILGGQASLSAASSLTAGATLVQPAAAAMSAASDATATATYVGVAETSLAAQSSLSASAVVVELGASIIVGTSDLAAAATRVALGAAALSAESSLTAVGGLIVNGGSVPLSAESDVTADATHVHTGMSVPMTAVLTIPPITPLPIYRLKTVDYEQTYTSVLPFSRYGIDTAKSIWIKDNVVTVSDYPYQDEIEQADYGYLGGRLYQLSQVEYEAFVAAGRPDLVEVR